MSLLALSRSLRQFDPVYTYLSGIDSLAILPLTTGYLRSLEKKKEKRKKEKRRERGKGKTDDSAIGESERRLSVQAPVRRSGSTIIRILCDSGIKAQFGDRFLGRQKTVENSLLQRYPRMKAPKYPDISFLILLVSQRSA